jgi:group I intron endonuclease
MTYRDIDPELAGIYVFKNNINGKCYIGQSVKLRSRIKDHFRNIKSKKINMPIYNAINKYGLHNFTLDIIESFVPNPELSNDELIKQLDTLEIKYIEEYKAYTEGYNCTKGGDFGVLGLKMTVEQKKKISEIVKRNNVKLYKPIYLYSLKDHSLIYAISVTAAAKIVNIHRSNLTKTANGTYKQTHNYLVAFSIEELEKRKLEWLTIPTVNNGSFKSKYKVVIKTNYKTVVVDSVKEAANRLKVSKSMIYSALSGYRQIKDIKLEKIIK